MNIDKDIERCKELIKTEHSNWIGLTNQEAISNVLSELEKKDKDIERRKRVYARRSKSWATTMEKQEEHFLQEIDEYNKELETYKKIVKLIIKKIWFVDVQDVVLGKCSECSKTPKDINECINCIIDWARKEVENE